MVFVKKRCLKKWGKKKFILFTAFMMNCILFLFALLFFRFHSTIRIANDKKATLRIEWLSKKNRRYNSVNIHTPNEKMYVINWKEHRS